MGFALPAAIGSAFSRARKTRSGSWQATAVFQMTACELSTAAQEGIKINIAIINNGYLGMVRQWQEFFYEGRYSATPLRSPDFVKLAEAHGHTGLRVTKREEVEEGRGAKRARHPEPYSSIFGSRREDSVYPMVAAGRGSQRHDSASESNHGDGR